MLQPFRDIWVSWCTKHPRCPKPKYFWPQVEQGLVEQVFRQSVSASFARELAGPLVRRWSLRITKLMIRWHSSDFSMMMMVMLMAVRFIAASVLLLTPRNLGSKVLVDLDHLRFFGRMLNCAGANIVYGL